MATLEVKAVEHLLGTGVPYAYAVKAGPWIFLTGHEAFDFDAGVTEAVSGPPGFPLFGRQHWRREGDFILQRVRQILQEFGSDLPHAVRLDQFYPTPAAVDPYHLARRAAFGDYIPPSTSVIMERCFGAESGISTSLIAVVPSPEYEIRKVYPKDVTASASSGFVPTIICNDFVFVAGQMASGREHGLDPRAHVPDHTLWGGTEIRKQTEFIIQERLRPALEAAGSSLERSLKAQVYIHNVENFPDFVDCLDAVLPDHPLCTDGRADQGLRHGGRYHRDQPDRADQCGKAREGGRRSRHSSNGRLWALRQSRRFPIAIRADGDRPGWPRDRQDDLAGVSWAFSRRIYPGRYRP